MKRIIFFELLKSFKARQHLRKTAIKVAVVGSLVLFVTLGFFIWAGVATVRFANEQLAAINLQKHTEVVQSQVESLRTAKLKQCWDQAMSIVTSNTWISAAPAENFGLLKVACLKTQDESLMKGESESTI